MDLPDDWDVPRPEVPDHLIWIWRCWHRLSLDRPWFGGGMGPAIPGRIPWTVLREWCEFHEYTVSDFAFLDRVIRDMDTTYIEFMAQKAKAAAR